MTRLLRRNILRNQLEVNPLYIPSLYKLSYILTEEGNLKKASELVTTLLIKHILNLLYKLIMSLAYNIYDEFIKKAEELKLQERYNDADEELHDS